MCLNIIDLHYNHLIHAVADGPAELSLVDCVDGVALQLFIYQG